MRLVEARVKEAERDLRLRLAVKDDEVEQVRRSLQARHVNTTSPPASGGPARPFSAI